MESLSDLQSRDQERGREESILEDDRSTANLLVPSRSQSQHFVSQENQAQPSQHTSAPPRWQFFWWLLTIAFCAFIFAVVKIYETRGNFTSVQKHMFNTISTALILALGLNFFVNHHPYAFRILVSTNIFLAMQEAFKSLARGSRSILLKQKNYSLREKDLILNIENLTAVVRLGWVFLTKPHAKPWVALCCIAWVRSSFISIRHLISP